MGKYEREQTWALLTDMDKVTDDFETRLPQDGDRLFVESSWVQDSRIVQGQEERFYRMPMGYKRAGDILIVQAAASVFDRHNIIYAALFCYRQAIELFLKKLIDEFGTGKIYSPKHTHNLNLLWERFMCIANERGQGNAQGLSIVQKLVEEMNEADQKSDGFRYPANRDGLPFNSGERKIAHENIHEVMQGLVNFFECAYLEFSHQDDNAGKQGETHGLAQ